jgi:rod shape-determining protein MreD
MKQDTLRRSLFFLFLCIAQILLLNRIQLFGFISPQLYVYFVLLFPVNHPKWAILLWSFSMGLIIDMFFNTAGLTCASLTLLGSLQPYLLQLFVPREADLAPPVKAKAMGWGKFTTYVSILVTLYCLVFFTIEVFSILNWIHWLHCVFGSALVTVLMILTFESVRE